MLVHTKNLFIFILVTITSQSLHLSAYFHFPRSIQARYIGFQAGVGSLTRHDNEQPLNGRRTQGVEDASKRFNPQPTTPAPKQHPP